MNTTRTCERNVCYSETEALTKDKLRIIKGKKMLSQPKMSHFP